MLLSPFGRFKFKRTKAQPIPKEFTLDDFSGGLDLSENDLKLKSNFSKVEDNIHRDIDGTKSVRWGTKSKFDMAGTVTGSILDMVYFRDKIVSFMTTGQVGSVTEAGVKAAIWTAAIATALPGAPGFWTSGLTQIDTTEFKNELVVVNGVDKPILFSKTHVATYLNDLPTGSNTNVPIAKYVTTVGNYCVMAGVAATPDVIYISAAGTSGTWPGDPAPNDSLSINIASYTAEQGGDIRGLSSFRNFLIIHFATSSVIMVLGEYSAAVHKPRVLDTIPQHGVISHRTMNVLESDIMYADEVGVHKARRNTFGNALDSEKVSLRVQKDFIADVMPDNTNRLKSFSVHNKLENRITYFLFSGTIYKIYTMTFDEGVKRIAWNKQSGWSYTSAVVTTKGRIFFGKGTKIFQYGNSVYAGEDYTGDNMDEDDGNWATATAYVVGDRRRQAGIVYIALFNHTSGVFATDLAAGIWEEYQGDAIAFDWEMPWTDANERMKKKRISYIALDTLGLASFTMEIYADKIRYDAVGADDPALSMEFVAGDSPGFGGGGGQPFGGGRRAADERMWGFPCEFKIAKIRVKGSTTERLQILAISLLLTKGTYKR